MLLNDGELYRVAQEDCITHMPKMDAESVDFSIFSPPFPALYAYTSQECDIGNSEDLKGEAKLHISFFLRQLVRVMKPGRVVLIHCMQIPRLKRSGELGTFDFRGLLIRLAQRAGFTYYYDWLISKNPQTEAIRTKSHSLQFSSMGRDRAQMHGQLGDYLIKLRAPGENKTPIVAERQVSRQEWIDWAESSWPWRGPAAVRQGVTLNAKAGRSENDTRHICPLQLDVIDRGVRLYSDPGEIVFSPFAGIGSEGYMSLKLGRRFYGCEIKPEYHAEALVNLERAKWEHGESERTLFSATPEAELTGGGAWGDGRERMQDGVEMPPPVDDGDKHAEAEVAV
jgi:DNA modification methylase